MELRDIEIFLTLADELHFGRAAERLRVSPARVSQAIKKQERSIGAQLFARDSRNVRLTPLGVQLRDELRVLHQGLKDTLERARLAARGATGRLRVGLMPFNVSHLHHYWRTFRARHPQWELQIRLMTYDDPLGQLRSGEFDACVMWLPVEEPDFTVGPTLLADPRIVAVSDEHPLAMRASAQIDVLADFGVGWGEDLGREYWEDAYLPYQTRRGRPIERLMRATDGTQLITAVTTGEIVMPFPSHVTEYWAIPTVRWLSLEGLPPLCYALVWRTEAENDAIRALATTIRDAGTVEL